MNEKWISVGRQEGFKMYSNDEVIIEVKGKGVP